MSWSEDDWGKPFFPTRFGSPQGHATERKMLDAVGGFDGIRTKIRTNPDGSTTILKTRGGMPVFTTELPVQKLVDKYVWQVDMDSGLVDLISYGELSGGYDPAVFYETTHAYAYNSSFVPFDAQWRKTTLTSPSINITGNISYSLGDLPVAKVRYDNSASRAFSPAVIGERDPNLLLKKLMAFKCPPSVFTGRCRLYVQALYGRPSLIHSMEGAPNISVPFYGGVEGKVVIDSSCGIYLDAATGDHWLFKVAASDVTAYPLKGTPGGEALRKMLRSSDTTLDPLAREHLEAHILSTCLPDFNGCQVMALNVTVQPYSMGYGWHWNWSGTKADMVMNSTFEQDSVNSAMESMHYRLNMGFVSGAFTASIEVIEGPVQWAVHYQSWCIAFPNWADFSLVKATPKHTSLFACSAPFYAFYAVDTLKVCRVSVSVEPPSTINEFSPGFGSEQNTVGLRGGFSRNESLGAGFSATFSVGSYSLPSAKIGASGSYSEKIVSEKSILIDKEFVTSFATSNELNLPNGYPINNDTSSPEWATGYYQGYPPVPVANPVPFGIQTYNPATYTVQLNRSMVSYTQKNVSGSVSYSSKVGIAIPCNESEAVYMFGRGLKTDEVSPGFETLFSSYSFVSGSKVSIRFNDDQTTAAIEGSSDFTEIGEETQYKWEKAGYNSTTISTTNFSASTKEASLWQQESLVCRLGTFSASIPEITVTNFYDATRDDVPDAFNTRTGVRIDTPILLAKGKVQNIGLIGDRVEPNMSLIVGWV